MTMLGRFFRFQRDFCQASLDVDGRRLPDGWKWIKGNYLLNIGIRHACAECIAAGRHGDEKLYDSGCSG